MQCCPVKPPSELPPHFARRPFLVSDATASGIGRGRLGTKDLARPFHGVRSRLHVDAVMAYAPRLRSGDRFSHTTALELWGAPLPRRHEGEVHVTLRSDGSDGRDRVRTVGVRGHRSPGGVTVELNGILVSDPSTAFLEAASILELDDLVAVADYLVLDPRVLEPGPSRPFVSLGQLRDTATSARGRWMTRARAAASLARTGVESRKETQLRLLLTRAHLPEPLCGYDLMNGRRKVGTFDLAWPEFQAIAEYDGDQHRTSKSQYDRDIHRYDAAADLEWRVVRVRDPGLTVRRQDTIERVRRALMRGGWSKRQNIT